MGKDLLGNELGNGLSQRSDGIYRGRCYNGNGKRVQVYGKNLGEVKRKLESAMVCNVIGLSPNITVAEYFKTWLQVYKIPHVKPGTVERYRCAFRLVEGRLGRTKVVKLTRLQIQNALNEISKSNSISSCQLARTVMHALCESAVLDGLIPVSPFKNVTVGGIAPKKHAKFLTEEEAQRVLECARGFWYENAVVFALNTGVRPGEMLALEVGDVNLVAKTVNINKTLLHNAPEVGSPKTRTSTRVIPLNTLALAAVKRQIECNNTVSREGNALFSKTGKFFPNRTWRYDVASLGKRAGVELYPHMFRHTFATRCFEAGVPMKLVQEYLGHASLKMTSDIYTHIAEKASAKGIELICGVSNGVSNGSENVIKLAE